MNRYLLLILLLAAAVGRVRAEDSKDKDKYKLIVTRNIFDSTRTAPRGDRQPEYTAPRPPPAEVVRLAGVIVVNGKTRALLQGTASALCGTVETGGELAGIRILELTINGARVKFGETEADWPVGSSLKRATDGPWELAASETVVTPPRTETGTSPSTSSGTATSTSSPTTGEAPAGGLSREEILKRLMERRKQEMNQ